MPKDEKLTQRLNEMLDEDKRRVVARLIEDASVALLGDYHFAYGNEAKVLSVVPLEDLKQFIQRVEEIRIEKDLAYEDAKKRLGEAHEKSE